MKEVWKDIKGFEGIYQVSNLGKVRSLTRKVWNYTKPGRILKPHFKNNGYLQISLSDGENVSKHIYIHRLVAQAFIPNPNNLPQINHKDFNKQNNVVNNLEWVTTSENQLHFRNSRRGRIANERPKAQHKFTERVLEHRKEILSLYKKGYKYEEIAERIEHGKDFVINVLLLYDAIGVWV